MIKAISNEIISFPAYRYRKLKDLLKLCSDPKDIDVVLKAVNHLCTVFCDILPSYRIRQYDDGSKAENDEEEAKEPDSKKVKVSKEVEQLRGQE